MTRARVMTEFLKIYNLYSGTFTGPGHGHDPIYFLGYDRSGHEPDFFLGHDPGH